MCLKTRRCFLYSAHWLVKFYITVVYFTGCETNIWKWLICELIHHVWLSIRLINIIARHKTNWKISIFNPFSTCFHIIFHLFCIDMMLKRKKWWRIIFWTINSVFSTDSLCYICYSSVNTLIRKLKCFESRHNRHLTLITISKM